MSSKRILVIKSSEAVVDPANLQVTPEYFYTSEGSFAEKLATFGENSYDEVFSIEVIPDEDAQAKLYRLLKSSGKLMIDGIVDRESGQALSTDLKIQGFMDIMAAKDPATGRRFIVCQRPKWETGDVAKVSIPVAVKMAASDLAEDELIDEDALLQGVEIPVVEPQDCGEGAGGKRRACANCTCGLADQEVQDAQAVNKTLSIEEKVVKASSCGNCAKGDAFRCASCPFLGKPAFEPGMEKVVLAMGDDDF